MDLRVSRQRLAPSVQDLVANFDRFGALGLSVNVSEFDVRVARKLAVQKQVYQNVAAACVQSAACSGITTWGFTDAHSWVDSRSARTIRSCSTSSTRRSTSRPARMAGSRSAR